MKSDSHISSRSTALRSLYWLWLFAGHVVAALGWWWLAPQGFGFRQPRFWLNTVVPGLIGCGALLGMVGIFTLRRSWVAGAATAGVTLWGGALAAACVLFPASAQTFVLPSAAAVVALAAAWYFLDPAASGLRNARLLGAMMGLGIGLFVPWAVKAPPPSTKPMNAVLEEFEFTTRADESIDLLERSKFAHLMPLRGGVTVAGESITLEILPLLTFEPRSRSPDGCWTNLAPPASDLDLRRRLVGQKLVPGGAYCRYDGTGPQLLKMQTTTDPARCEVVAFARLEAPIYSHLNSFCDVYIRGHRDLSLRFSPCREIPIVPGPADYPSGRPAQLAALDDQGTFRVYEARSGEKGPFKTLAEGLLHPQNHLGGRLQIEVLDEGRRAATLTLYDWAMQASTEPSPTAGWGLPQNAIEIRRLGETRDATVVLHFTLAGTSVGRGFDSVGHAAGTYRNRITVDVPPLVEKR